MSCKQPRDALQKLAAHEWKQLEFYRSVMGRQRPPEEGVEITRDDIESGRDAVYWKRRALNAERALRESRDLG